MQEGGGRAAVDQNRSRWKAGEITPSLGVSGGGYLKTPFSAPHEDGAPVPGPPAQLLCVSICPHTEWYTGSTVCVSSCFCSYELVPILLIHPSISLWAGLSC